MTGPPFLWWMPRPPIDQLGRSCWMAASDSRCKSASVVPGFMIRLGDGADGLGVAGGRGLGGGARPEVAGWFEQRAAQVLQEPQPVGGHGEAAPAAGGPVEHGPHEGE